MSDSVISRIPSKAPLLVKSRTWWHHSIRGTREVMKIFLDVPNVTVHGIYYVGTRPRLASVTAVKSVLHCCRFLGGPKPDWDYSK